ncbi:MAG: LPS export ABC transporter periplasmic protein LptC, partial [Bacteroidales bacterium]|nr:LPS export ABC transporter periplasmic protein LptC [Bacteroidales bacterium]
FFSCSNDEEVVKAVYHKEGGPSEITEEMLVYVSRAGKLNYRFYAPVYYGYEYPKKMQVAPKGLVVVGFGSDNDSAFVLTADYGIHREQERRMEAKHHVVIRNLETGEVVETEQIVWDMDAHRVYSGTQTKQTRPDGSVYIGDSFESDENFEHYTIVKPKMVIYEE